MGDLRQVANVGRAPNGKITHVSVPKNTRNIEESRGDGTNRKGLHRRFQTCLSDWGTKAQTRGKQRTIIYTFPMPGRYLPLRSGWAMGLSTDSSNCASTGIRELVACNSEIFDVGMISYA